MARPLPETPSAGSRRCGSSRHPLQQFGDFLLRARVVKEKAGPYCVHWVRQFLARPASNEPLWTPRTAIMRPR
jgi:hypothetical protein